MKIENLDHIGIAIKDINVAAKLYETLLGIKVGEIIEIPDQGIKSAYIPIPGVGIELLQPTDPNGGIQKFIDKKGEGFHHLAVKVPNIDAVMKELADNGIRLIKSTTYGKMTVFIHPASTNGVLIELCE